MSEYLTIEDLTAYQIASELCDYVWEVVSKLDWFAKKTVGSQFITSADSIAANIAEGFGRYHKKDKIKFYYNARASAIETAHWNNKSVKRKLLTTKESDYIKERLDKMPKEINMLIKLTNNLKD